MHAEVLQDVREAFGAAGAEARLEEMRDVGKILDSRLKELRAEAADSGSGSLKDWVEAELRKLQESLSCDLQESHSTLSEELSGLREQMHEQLHESLMTVHDRMTKELEGVAGQLHAFDERLGSAETDLALMEEADHETGWRQAIEQTSHALREEFYRHTREQLDRLTALEQRLHHEQGELLSAVRSAAAAHSNEEGERTHQREWLQRAFEDAREHDEELAKLTEEMTGLKSWAASVQEREAHTQSFQQHVEQEVRPLAQQVKQLERQLEQRIAQGAAAAGLEDRFDLLQAKVEALAATSEAAHSVPQASLMVTRSLEQRMDEVGERLDYFNRCTQETRRIGQHLRDVEGTAADAAGKADAAEKALESLQKQLHELKAAVKETASVAATPPLLPGTGARENQMLQQLERKVEFVADDIRQQLESQLVDAQRKSQQRITEDVDARLAQLDQSRGQRFPAELRKELEERLMQSSTASQNLARELRQELEVRSSQTQRLGEDLRKEIDMKVERSNANAGRLLEELRHDVDARTSQAQAASQRLAEDMRRLGADLEVRLVQAQGSSQRIACELRKDLEISAAKSQSLSSSDLRHQIFGEFRQEIERRSREEKQQLVADLRQELGREISQSTCTSQRLSEELQQVRVSLQADFERRISQELDRHSNIHAKSVQTMTQELDRQASQLTKNVQNISDELLQVRTALEGTKGMAEETQRKVRELNTGGETSTLELAEDVAAKAAEKAAIALEDTVSDSLARCNVAVRSCEKFAQQLEAGLRDVSSELRVQSQVNTVAAEALSARGSPLAQSMRGSPLATGAVSVTSLGGQPRRLFGRQEEPETQEVMEEESEANSLLTALMKRVNQQSEAIDVLRQKNSELSSAMDSYNLEQKVSRSLAGLED
eukprot:TRINITY_DN60988_c0_g1_i1.p1 TRINITY_DN60988_c0_g1~~TRINITY_DN60988_c0_g1_i1.p1  ORF type:complete len:1011 (-),score=287.85 TRINITY_DN60988_c0_g1_i1:42-2726(-)